ncbi:hypothetical protein ABZW47_16280 [Streptomyces sp. NPDC004549]|uniref:hypothetical protein n=1 Tax=Streptomyces sp. NPDC004549 TaxID=3154283 RepID=UPI0033B07A5C
MSERHLACAAQTASTTRRLGGAEAAIIVTVLTVAGSLAHTGIAVIRILHLLAGAALLSIALVTAVSISPLRGLNRAVRALLASGTTR